MATREEWVRHFEDVNGRKPSPEEFMEAKKEGFVIASEGPSAQVSEQVEAQQVDSSETTEEVTADSVVDTQPDEAQVALEEEASKQMPELNLEKEQEKETPKTSQIPLENPYYKPKVTKNNAFVNIALPIIILVLGILFVILSWTLPIGFIFTFLAFFLIILAIVTLVLSLKSTRKALSIIALVMSIIFFMTSLAGAGYQAVKYVMNHADQFEANIRYRANEYIDKDYQFDWTEDQFKELKVDSLTLDEVLDAHGKATDAEWGDDGEAQTLDLTYSKEKTGSDNFVRLTFKKSKDGIYILEHASADFSYDKVKEVSDYQSNWTKEDYDKLTVGTQADLLKGTRLSDVVSNHSEASFSTHELTQTDEGDLTQKVSLSFYDYSPDSGKLKTVHLTFDYDKRENEYFLTDKSDE
ncbi:MAG: CD20-like domain-containing protein [Streptococcus salivarius]